MRLPADAPADFRAAADAGAWTREARPDHLTASALVLSPDRSQVLLVLHKKVGLWMQPGGHVEDDASLAAAALREAVEETGVAGLRLASEEPVSYHRHAAPCGARDHLDVRFLVLAPEPAAVVVSEESDDVRWFAVDQLPADRVEDLAALVAITRG